MSDRVRRLAALAAVALVVAAVGVWRARVAQPLAQEPRRGTPAVEPGLPEAPAAPHPSVPPLAARAVSGRQTADEPSPERPSRRPPGRSRPTEPTTPHDTTARDERPPTPARRLLGLWISRDELAQLATLGPAWKRLRREASRPVVSPSLSDQNDPMNVRVLAKALWAARSDNDKMRQEVVRAVLSVMGTEQGGRTLAVARKLVTYVIAADLVGLPPLDEARFRAWLEPMLARKMAEGRSLRSVHEESPNNWGTHAGATRAAIAVYLGSRSELQRTAQVFRGWLGDRSAYAGFRWGHLSWQADPGHPVGVNRAGALLLGHPVDGVLPDDQRRGGGFAWPPPKENYVYEALQGALVQAVILSRAGYDVWSWEDRALLRAYKWLYEVADFPARGDDVWQLPVVDFYYGTSFWDGSPTSAGKNVGWTDWTHARR
jgi:hypothetical protein